VKAARTVVQDDSTLRAKLDEIAAEAQEPWWKSKIAAEVAVLDYEKGRIESAYQMLQSVTYTQLRPQIADRIEADFAALLHKSD